MAFINKKQAQISFGYVFLFIIVFAFFFMMYITTLSSLVDNRVPMPDNFENDLVHARIVNKCFAYVDERTGESIGNVLDQRKLTNENLKNCFIISEKNYQPVKVSVFGVGFNTINLNSATGSFDELSVNNCLLRLSSNNKTVLCQIKVES